MLNFLLHQTHASAHLLKLSLNKRMNFNTAIETRDCLCSDPFISMKQFYESSDSKRYWKSEPGQAEKSRLSSLSKQGKW